MRILILIGKGLLALVLICLLVFVVKYSGTIREAVSDRSVKGVSTSFEKEAGKDINDYANGALNQVMNIKVSDVLNGISRLNKVNNDLKEAKKYIIEQVNGALRK